MVYLHLIASDHFRFPRYLADAAGRGRTFTPRRDGSFHADPVDAQGRYILISGSMVLAWPNHS